MQPSRRCTVARGRWCSPASPWWNSNHEPNLNTKREPRSVNLPGAVQVVEVGPRDGLQNEAVEIATSDKIAFVNALAAAGHSIIEASAFVSPKWVPQMADASAVFAQIERRPGVRYTALVPNVAGLV